MLVAVGDMARFSAYACGSTAACATAPAVVAATAPAAPLAKIRSFGYESLVTRHSIFLLAERLELIRHVPISCRRYDGFASDAFFSTLEQLLQKVVRRTLTNFAQTSVSG